MSCHVTYKAKQCSVYILFDLSKNQHESKKLMDMDPHLIS